MLERQRRTKILATLGPATDAPGVLDELFRAGVNVVRLNFSHGDPSGQAKRAAEVRAAAQRVGMSEADLRAINGIPPRMLIKAGSALMVPRATTTREDVSSQVADNGQVAFTPEIVTRRTTVRAGKRETVASIAHRYRVSVDNVADWNDVKKTANFKSGQAVVMYLPVRLTTASAARVPSADVKQTSARGRPAPAASTRSPAKHQAATSRKGGTPPKAQKKKR